MQHNWEWTLHEESIALKHQLDFAVVACAGVDELPDLRWKRNLEWHRACDVVVMDWGIACRVCWASTMLAWMVKQAN